MGTNLGPGPIHTRPTTRSDRFETEMVKIRAARAQEARAIASFATAGGLCMSASAWWMWGFEWGAFTLGCVMLLLAALAAVKL